jgi:DNA-directed RNA polymerase alpha subunit
LLCHVRVRGLNEHVLALLIQHIMVCSFMQVVNALRRIMTSEAPTMAIESVFVVNNTSVIQDEVLSHRLGLVPLKVDPRYFQYKVWEHDSKTHASHTVCSQGAPL